MPRVGLESPGLPMGARPIWVGVTRHHLHTRGAEPQLEALCWIAAIYGALRFRRTSTSGAIFCSISVAYALLTRPVEGVLISVVALLLIIPSAQLRKWSSAEWRGIIVVSIGCLFGLGVTLLVDSGKVWLTIDFRIRKRRLEQPALDWADRQHHQPCAWYHLGVPGGSAHTPGLAMAIYHISQKDHPFTHRPDGCTAYQCVRLVVVVGRK